MLFIRLCNLRTWLRWHADVMDRASKKDSVEIVEDDNPIAHPFGNKLKTQYPAEQFTAARSILAVLMKLLEVSSAMATSDGNANNVDASPQITTSGKSKMATGSPKQKQHKPLAPLLSTPIRNTWVECISLCLALGSSLPGNLRTDPYTFVNKMLEISNWNPRSKMAAGGVRLAALQVVGRVCSLNIDLAKRTAPYAWEILQCCHKGLLSGGAGEPGHRAACVKTACCVVISCRKVASGVRGGDGADSFSVPGAMEERAVQEGIKFIKRATSDKYPEVRLGAAMFAGLIAPMLIRNIPTGSLSRNGGGRDNEELATPLAWLEEVTQFALKNIDDESAGVATAWASALARCICVSVEHGTSVRDAQSEDQASRRSADVDDEAPPSSDNSNLDLAAKFKAFSESRRASAATAICSSVPSAIAYLTKQFVRCGGETASNRCGGSFSCGGRAARIGFADALTEFLRLQASKGDFQLTEAVRPVLEMVGSSFEKQIMKAEKGGNSLSSEIDFFSTPSPNASPEKRMQTISGAFLSGRNPRAKSSADPSIGRLLASDVLRKGISENLSESLQLNVLLELTASCNLSIKSTVDGNNNSESPPLNRHEIQVALIEISHLVVALGEAGSSSLDDLLAMLDKCLSHSDHGVRYEAAIVHAAIAQAFPAVGRKFVLSSLNEIVANVDEIRGLASKAPAITSPTPKSRFRRSVEKPHGNSQSDQLMHSQCVLHGKALALSMLMHEFPHIMGGVNAAIVVKVFNVAEKLLHCQFDEALVQKNPTAACTCIRSGYCLLSGVLTMGTEAVIPHISSAFTFWQNSGMNVLPGVSKFSPTHDLLIVESLLASVVTFLKFCPDLLLAVPDALNRLTALLEKLFPLVSSGGKLDQEKNSTLGNARLSSAISSIMEAYSWLPPGSFPLSADRIFTFASNQIQELSESDILCSILDSLLSREDKLIEAHSVERAVSPGQIGGSVRLDTNISMRGSDILHHNEREATLHLLAWRKKFRMRHHDDEYHESPILGLYLREGDENSIPTPLHGVGTWREPLDPTGSSKVRLLDSSIHVFAATFGLQDGQTQAKALRMLESMYTSSQMEKEKLNRFAVGTTLISESQGKVKPREEDVCASNVIATILSCLQALPLHEATYDTLIGVGPPWMERATNLLLRLLPSPSDVIRRGAAEGLSYLATLGVSEDAHTLQSTILHSLDEVMKGNTPGNQPKSQTDTISFARPGALLALACIQRAAKRMKKTENDRAVSRSVSRAPDSNDSGIDGPPFLIMMTRILPSLTTQNPEVGSHLARTYALHSFGVMVSNSIRISDETLSPDKVQIIWKAVEAVETSFLGAWSPAVSDISKGKEREKFASEAAFLAVLLRLMTTILPWLQHFNTLDRWIPSRFSCIASTILEWCGGHPVVLFEGTVFFERLNFYSNLVSPNSCCVTTTENTAGLAMSFLLSILRPPQSKVVADKEEDFTSCRGPLDAQRSAAMCLKALCSSCDFPNDAFLSFDLANALYSFLHDRCGRRSFQHFTNCRSLALSRAVTNYFEDCQLIETETISLIHALLKAQVAGRKTDEQSYICMRWLLSARSLVSGDMIKRGEQTRDTHIDFSVSTVIERAGLIGRRDASITLGHSNPPRWQLKCIAANIASVVIETMLDIESQTEGISFSNYKLAHARCTEMLREGGSQLYSSSHHSYPIFHIEELVTMACSASAATSNHSEIPSVQISGVRILISLFHAFGRELDFATNDGTYVLQQFSSQIISAVKHALQSESSHKDTASGHEFHRLFAVGCEALFVMLRYGFITDSIAMKRLLKPVLLSAEEVPFSSYPNTGENIFHSLSSKSVDIIDDPRTYPLFRISKLSFTAKVSVASELGQIDQTSASMVSDNLETHIIVPTAVHAAASAIDGFLLHTSKSNSDDESRSTAENFTGLTFENRSNLDDTVEYEIIKSWPTFAAYAVKSLLASIAKSSSDDDVEPSSKEWLRKLYPIACSGLRRAISGTERQGNSNPTKLHESETVALCIYSLRCFVMEKDIVNYDVFCPHELIDIVHLLTKSIIFSYLGLSDAASGSQYESFSDSRGDNLDLLLNQSCMLIEDICRNIETLPVKSTVLTRLVLEPLAAVQEHQITMTNDNIFIICSFLRSSQSLLENYPAKEKATLEKSLVELTLSISKDAHDDIIEKINSTCSSLLKSCCEQTCMSDQEWGLVAAYTASNGLWDAWTTLSSTLPLTVLITSSIKAVTNSLAELKRSSNHTRALVALRMALQSVSNNDPCLICFALQHVGCEVLQLLRVYSLRINPGKYFDENRITVCAESVKVNMIAFQYLNTASMEENGFVSFLSALFDVLVEAISFNGLPNHPSGKNGADETIGRMCAQFFVYVARTTPAMFKSTLTVMSVERRSVLEAAVRADMGGYAAPKNDPAKKRLNLKGFVR